MRVRRWAFSSAHLESEGTFRVRKRPSKAKNRPDFRSNCSYFNGLGRSDPPGRHRGAPAMRFPTKEIPVGADDHRDKPSRGRVHSVTNIMATFTTTDARHILEAAGETAPDPSRCRYAQQCFSDIASAYLRERPSPASFTAAIRVADKLSKIAALARSLRGTITYGDATLAKGVRDALTRARSQLPGHPREDLSELLVSLQELEACASSAYRELRESAKRATDRKTLLT